MSLELVRKVNQEHPELLQANINSTCYQFVVHVIAALRANGRKAYHVAKSPGEGQYTPPGFVSRIVIGLDGKPYPCSGVSHDAIWVDGIQVDTIARGNDSPEPIFNPDGSRMTGVPVWNEIPQQFWRPNNPPLKDEAQSDPQPPPPPPPRFPYPDENTAGKAFQARIKQAYKDAGRAFPDPNDEDAFRHFIRFGYSSHEMDAQKAADKHIAELRAQLGV